MSGLDSLNQWVDFDQTCIEALLGEAKRWLYIFGDLDLIYKFIPGMKRVLRKSTWVSTEYWLFWKYSSKYWVHIL